ncbi:FAD-dependent oxidoreductase [candidate division KSB1 bacterium]|nr:FAD-dependent oxidoreductase [candidate division KSB1 bacterium]
MSNSSITAHPQHLTILGGGPAGLAVGYFAAKQRLPFTVLEAGEVVGGNARTIRYGEFLFDTGAHRFHDKHAEITRELLSLLGEDLIVASAPSLILWRNRRIDFPLSPGNLLSKLGPLLTARAAVDYTFSRNANRGAGGSLEALAVARYGKTIADLFLLHYSEKLWGLPANMLSPFVSGQRLKGLNLTTFLVEALRGRRAKTEHLDGKFYYPRRGIGMITERLAQTCGEANIRTNARVTRLVHSDRRIRAVEVNHRERIEVDTVVTSLPLGLNAGLLDPAPPARVIELASKLKFRHVVILILFLHRERVSHHASLYFPEREIPFTRIYEPKNRSAEMAPRNQTSLAIEFPCGIEDNRWRMSAQELADLAIPILESKRLITRADVFDATIHRIPFAYPILACGIEGSVRELVDYLSVFENLQPVGRNGLFNYTHIHDLLEAGRLLIDAPRSKATVSSG